MVAKRQPTAWLLTASSFSRYVYIPVGGSQHGLLGTLFSTAVTFAFVSFWHGGYDYLWCWAALNWLGVTVENAVQRLVQTPYVRDSVVSRWLGTAEPGGLATGGRGSSDSPQHGPFLPDGFKEYVPRGSRVLFVCLLFSVLHKCFKAMHAYCTKIRKFT